jgi:hypothetical protein
MASKICMSSSSGRTKGIAPLQSIVTPEGGSLNSTCTMKQGESLREDLTITAQRSHDRGALLPRCGDPGPGYCPCPVPGEPFVCPARTKTIATYAFCSPRPPHAAPARLVCISARLPATQCPPGSPVHDYRRLIVPSTSTNLRRLISTHVLFHPRLASISIVSGMFNSVISLWRIR